MGVRVGGDGDAAERVGRKREREKQGEERERETGKIEIGRAHV